MPQKKNKEKYKARERQLARKKQGTKMSRTQMIWVGISLFIAFIMVVGVVFVGGF